ncbi:MAG TPA: hypothetical protein VFA85_08570 [Terriglobales bacterium]|nr:hypothetical protein [Terriglobales bacterium]
MVWLLNWVRSTDWLRVAQIVQGFSAPAIALSIGIVTFVIQRRQTRTQEQQAKISGAQHRLALMPHRMKVFNATTQFIAGVAQSGDVTLPKLFEFMQVTREHYLLFGPEIGKHIDELYKKGVRLETIHAMRGPQGNIRPEDANLKYELVTWFAEQISVAENNFLKYLNFREP